MISNIEIVQKNGIFASYFIDGKKHDISIETIKECWNDYDEDYGAEFVRLYPNDEKIAMLLTNYNGQSGIILIWDAINDEITHISNGDYAVAICLYDNYIYVLLAVMGWGVKLHSEMYRVPIGIKNNLDEGEKLEGFNFEQIEFYNGNADDIDLFVNSNEYVIRIGQKKYPILRSKNEKFIDEN